MSLLSVPSPVAPLRTFLAVVCSGRTTGRWPWRDHCVDEPMGAARVERHRVTGAQHGLLKPDFHVQTPLQDVEVLEVVVPEQLREVLDDEPPGTSRA